MSDTPTDDNVHQLPPREGPPPLFFGPFTEHRVLCDGRCIPLLTGGKREDGSVWLTLDNRFGAEFPDEATAQQAVYLIANALAIGQGYGSMNAETRDRPFAPRVYHIAPEDIR